MAADIVKKGAPAGAAIEREGFGSREIEQRRETASSAVQAQARAEIEARYVMALQRPRSDDQVRVRLLHECERPNFAARAFYAVPREGLKRPGRITGTRGVIEGLSVRFAEAAIRLSTNIVQATRTIYDDDEKRIVTVGATDLESNATYTDDLVIDKTIERRFVKEGMRVLGSRTNSAGDTVHLIQATEEELRQKQGGLVSRVFRTLALRLVPADTLDECEKRIAKTMADSAKADPDAARKAVVDAFASLGVMPADLTAYLGQDVGSVAPPQIVHLRGLYAAIAEGEVSWADVVAERVKAAAEQAGQAAQSTGGKVAEAIRKRTAKKAGGGGGGPAVASGTPGGPPAGHPQATTPPAETASTSTEKPEPGGTCEACGAPMQGNSCQACGFVKGERIPE